MGDWLLSLAFQLAALECPCNGFPRKVCAVAVRKCRSKMQPTNARKRDWSGVLTLVTSPTSNAPPPRYPGARGEQAPKVPYDANSPSDQHSRADGLGSQFLALLNFHIRPRRIPLSLPPPVTLNSLTTRTHLTTISTEIPTNHLRDQHRRQTRSTSEYPHRARASTPTSHNTPHPLPRCACPQH